MCRANAARRSSADSRSDPAGHGVVPDERVSLQAHAATGGVPGNRVPAREVLDALTTFDRIPLHLILRRQVVEVSAEHLGVAHVVQERGLDGRANELAGGRGCIAEGIRNYGRRRCRRRSRRGRALCAAGDLNSRHECGQHAPANGGRDHDSAQRGRFVIRQSAIVIVATAIIPLPPFRDRRLPHPQSVPTPD